MENETLRIGVPGSARAGAILTGWMALLLAGGAGAASAAPQPALESLEREVLRLRQDYAARQVALQQEMESRLAVLDEQIAALKTASAQADADAGDAVPAAVKPELPPAPALDVSGDFRLRYEHTSGHALQPARDRAVLRGRLGASYAVNDRVTVGARMTTGDPGDPNSADVTMGAFVDDLTVSLDRAYVRYSNDEFDVVGGKFARPFVSTDLVWDGDVNPYGLAGSHTLYRGSAAAVRLTGIYSIVDEQIAAAGSDMLGAQASLDLLPRAGWQFSASAAYFDYRIGSLATADTGDIRGNNLAADGAAYLSDFDLLDVVVSMDYADLADGWPLRIVGDYARNLGAAVPEDSAWSLDVSLGALGDIGDWRFAYGYTVAGTDAVLAAFSHDNTTYATNYREHTVTVDYVPLDNTYLNLTGYLYRRDDFSLVNQPGDNDWVSRFRLNVEFRF